MSKLVMQRILWAICFAFIGMAAVLALIGVIALMREMGLAAR